jgi:hypothetical protein
MRKIIVLHIFSGESISVGVIVDLVVAGDVFGESKFLLFRRSSRIFRRVLDFFGLQFGRSTPNVAVLARNQGKTCRIHTIVLRRKEHEKVFKRYTIALSVNIVNKNTK